MSYLGCLDVSQHRAVLDNRSLPAAVQGTPLSIVLACPRDARHVSYRVHAVRAFCLTLSICSASVLAGIQAPQKCWEEEHQSGPHLNEDCAEWHHHGKSPEHTVVGWDPVISLVSEPLGTGSIVPHLEEGG